MRGTRRTFTKEFKLGAVKEVESGKSSGLVARQLEIDQHMLNRWRRELSRRSGQAFSGHGRRMLGESREAELERKIGQLTMENDFLKKVLVALEEQQESGSGGKAFTKRSEKKRGR